MLISLLIGEPFWNRGLAIQAGSVIIKPAFDELDIERIYASVFDSNPVSARILDEKWF